VIEKRSQSSDLNLTHKPAVLNLFAEGNQIQSYNFLESCTNDILTQVIGTFCFMVEQSLLHKILESL